MPRHSKKVRLELDRCRETINSQTATEDEKAAARKKIDRIHIERKRRLETTKIAGRRPDRKNFSSDEDHQEALRVYWQQLDRLTLEREARRILDDPESSSYLRSKAYERLGKELVPDVEQNAMKKQNDDAPRREDFGFRSGADWAEFEASKKEAQFQTALAVWRETAPPLDPALAAFLGVRRINNARSQE